MHLPETARQLLAGAAAALAFLAAFFGLSLIAPVAVGAALIVYVALLLLVRRTPPPDAVILADGVSEADLSAALEAIETAADRLRAADARAPASDAGLFARMAEILRRIRGHHARDPKDLRHTKRFLRHDLPRLVETSEAYVDLANRAGPSEADRLAQLSTRIGGFVPALERIEQACLENDFHKLDVETDVLSRQLQSR
ncbi:MAG: 5-bromo-4-chloroindolyl phosphate hydrolysis family protein [Pseudomonadota bacterium]